MSGSDSKLSLIAGMNAFLSKPIDMEKLLNQIGALLQLDWTYQSQADDSSSDPNIMVSIVVPPPEEMEILHRLAKLGNMRAILERTTHLAELDPRYHPFATKLSLLAKNYQSKALLHLVEECLPGVPFMLNSSPR